MATDKNDPPMADALIIFGISGDLARKMTLKSLYLLESRGLLSCPVIGVTRGWTTDDLRENARTAVEASGVPIDAAVLDRLTERLTGVKGGYDDPATFKTLRAAIADAKTPVSYLEIPPPLFGMVVKGLADAGLTEGGRVVVEKPFGTDLASARKLNADLHAYIDESQLFRIDHFLGKMSVDDLQYLRFANSFLEPIWNRQLRRLGANHDGRGLRRRGSRPLLRPRRRDAGRHPEPPDAGPELHRDGAADRPRRGHDRRPEARRLRGDAGARHRALRPRPVRRLSRRRGRRQGFADRDLCRYGAVHRELALVGRAVLHPSRQGHAGDGHRGPRDPQAAATSGLPAEARTPTRQERDRPPDRATSGRPDSTPCPECRGERRSGTSTWTWTSRRWVARVTPPTRSCSRRRCAAIAVTSLVRTQSRRPGGSCSRARQPAPGAEIRARLMGPRRDGPAHTHHGGWRDPWLPA